MKKFYRLPQIYSEGQRLTLVIDSGVNNHSLGNKQTILTSWIGMFYRVFGDTPKQGIDDYIIAFDR